ncbi:MAG: DUF4123 domain-containing protein [Burkholderiales bacterium]|nr:DUF4123 domain-containing protein [Burkholderiales bacterium]
MTTSSIPSKNNASEQAVNGVFILVDASQFAVVWRVLEYRFRRLQWLSLCEDPAEAPTGPLLIHVGHDQTRTLAWFLEHTQGIHCMSWIVAPLGLIELREHFRSLMQVRAHDGSECGVRFYDTRVLPAWYQTLSQEQEAYALGPVNSWTYMDREGMPCTIFGRGETEVPSSQTLQLSEEQEATLLNAALPDIVLQQLEQSGNPDLEAMPQSERYRFIANQIAKAKRQYGILSVDELAMFCSLALGIGQDFDMLEPVAQVLQQYADVPASLDRTSLQC